MKNLFHHINQALYETNQLFWRGLIRPWLVLVIFAVCLFAMSFIPIVFIHNEIFFFAWPAFSIVCCSFFFMSYLIYDKSKNQKTPEPEVIFESEVNGFSIVKEPQEHVPLTVKQSLWYGFGWTVCIYGVFVAMLFAWSMIDTWRNPEQNVSLICDEKDSCEIENRPVPATSQNIPAVVSLTCDEQRLREIENRPAPATFSDYSVESVYDGVIAELDELSHDNAQRFYSYFMAGRNAGVHFGGHYTVGRWAMTGWGYSMGVMDAYTGKVSMVPYGAVLGFEYYPDSRLVIADSISILRNFASSSPDTICGYFMYPGESKPLPRYFVINNNGTFTELTNETGD